MSLAHTENERHPLKGVTVPLVTPLREDGSPDVDALPRVVEYVLNGGADALFVLGSNGENPNVLTDEIGPVVRAVSQHLKSLGVRGAVPLMCGTGGASTREAVKRGEAALAAGADLLVSHPPCYFVHAESELVAHFREIAALGAPLVVYNIPRYTQNPITPDVYRAVFEIPNVIGAKDSSGDEGLFLEIVRLARERQGLGVSQGSERKLAWALRSGATGITPGLANIAPRVCADLFRAATSGRLEEAERLQALLDRLGAIHRLRSGIAGTKGAVAVLGLCAARVSPPFFPLSSVEMAEVERILRECGVLGETPQAQTSSSPR